MRSPQSAWYSANWGCLRILGLEREGVVPKHCRGCRRGCCAKPFVYMYMRAHIYICMHIHIIKSFKNSGRVIYPLHWWWVAGSLSDLPQVTLWVAESRFKLRCFPDNLDFFLGQDLHLCLHLPFPSTDDLDHHYKFHIKLLKKKCPGQGFPSGFHNGSWDQKAL